MEESVGAVVALGVPDRAVADGQDINPFLSKLGGVPVRVPTMSVSSFLCM